MRIQKLAFLIWVICLGVFTQFVFNPSDPTPLYVIIAVLAGGSSFGFFWLIALFRFTKKPRLNATQLPLLSIALTLLFVLGLSKASALQPAPAPIAQAQRRCYFTQYSWDMVTQSLPCPAGTTETRPQPSPRPSIAPKSASNYVKPTQPSNLITCTGPDGKQLGEKVTKEYCDSFNKAWDKPQPQQQVAQPSYDYDYDYDYYVPAYTYQPSSYTYTPPAPTYNTYVPSYPTANIESEPFPTIGPSYNPNEICQTYTTNAGSITVCK